MKRLTAVLVVLAVIGLVNVAVAEGKPDPTGTWKWRLFNQSAEQTLKLKLEGDKLTGSILRRNNQETPLEKATYKDGIVSFKVNVTSERSGEKIVIMYTGTISGVTIKGKILFEHPEQIITRDWDAKRIE